MSNLVTLPKGDSAWLLRKAIQQVIEQVNTLEANVNPAATGGSLNTQVLFNDNGAVKGDTNLTFNKTTDTLTTINGQFTDLNASGNVAVGNLTVSGTFTALGGENASAVRAAASDYAAVTFDGATASTRIASACQAIGTGAFSMWTRFRVPTSIPGSQFPGIICLSDSSTTASRANAIRTFIDTGVLVFQRYGATTSDSRNASISGFAATYAGQVVDLVVTRTGTTLKVYINGTDTAYTETTSGTPPAWSDTVVSDFCIVGALNSGATSVFTGRIYRSVVFNRALSATDVTELITIGVNPADQWGTQTQIANTTTQNGGFETAGAGGADVFANWAEFTSGSGAITRDTTDFSPNLGSTASAKLAGTDGSAICALNSTFTSLQANKRYRISSAHKRSAAGTIRWISGNTNVVLLNFSTTTSWADYSGEFVMPVTEGIKTDLVGAVTYWYDNVIVERIGAIVDLDYTVGTGYQATDRSTNALHGTLFNGVEFTQPKRMAVLYATTTASGNTQLLGSLAIPTNAVIEDVIVNSTGSATVSVGNVSAGTQIVNGASVVSGRQKLTIATPFSTTGNLWVNSSAAVTLQFTIIYTIAA